MDDVTYTLEKPADPPLERPKAPPVDYSDFRSARFMALDTRPVSVEAKSLIAHVTYIIEEWEVQSGARKNKRKASRRKFERVVARFIGDLVIAASQSRERWSYRPHSRASFSRSSVGYRLFKSVSDALHGLNLIAVAPGFCDREAIYRMCTRLRSTEALLSLFEQHSISRTCGQLHFQQSLPLRTLVLKARSTRKGHLKISGHVLCFPRTDHTQRLQADMRELNQFIAEHELEGGTHRGYRRIFNCGDDPDFNWNKGGRIYSLGEDSYQRQKKKNRLRMLIDGEPVTEIDVRSSFLTILYALNGEFLDQARDPYEIDGLPRDVVKAWITVTLGYDKFPTRWPAETLKDLRKDGIIKKGQRLTAPMVQEAVLAVHPVLRSWPKQSTTCFDLMFLESEAIVGTMLRLMQEHRTASLSVHDSLIVPKSKLDVAREILSVEYERATGVRPELKVN